MSRLNVANFRHPDGTSDNINLDSSGRVGIGTSSPDRPFHLKGSGTRQLKIESTDNSVELELVGGGSVNYVSSDDSLSFYVNGSTRATIESTNGNFQFNSGYGSVATAYGVRAWVNFNGEGTVAIRSSGNVSSITDNATGNYSVNFTNAMPDTDYVYFGGIGDSTSSYAIRTLSSRQTSASFSTTSHQFACVTDGNNGFDAEAVTIAFIR